MHRHPLPCRCLPHRHRTARLPTMATIGRAVAAAVVAVVAVAVVKLQAPQLGALATTLTACQANDLRLWLPQLYPLPPPHLNHRPTMRLVHLLVVLPARGRAWGRLHRDQRGWMTAALSPRACMSSCRRFGTWSACGPLWLASLPCRPRFQFRLRSSHVFVCVAVCCQATTRGTACRRRAAPTQHVAPVWRHRELGRRQ